MAKSGARVAEHYDRTRETAGFGDPEPIEVRRAVTISVRFSDSELDEVRRHAEEAGVKVTAYIRDAALEAARPVDRVAVARLAAEVERKAHDLRSALG